MRFYVKISENFIGLVVILWTDAVVEYARVHRLSSIIEKLRAERPVEFKRDFHIITHELSHATLLFSLVITEPSGTFELIHQISI